MKEIRTLVLMLSLFNLGSLMAARPSTHASGIVTSTNCSQMTVSWTPGNGTSRLVVIRQGDTADFQPQDGISYQSNSTFGAGIGSGASGQTYIVYNGSGSQVTIIGLSQKKTYYLSVIEYSTQNMEYLTQGLPVAVDSTLYADYQLQITPLDSCKGTALFKFKPNIKSNIKNVNWSLITDGQTYPLNGMEITVAYKNTTGYIEVILNGNHATQGCPLNKKYVVKVFPKGLIKVDFKNSSDTVQDFYGNYFEMHTVSGTAPFPMGITYNWDFGDSSSSHFPKMRKSYSDEGRYYIKLYTQINTYNLPSGCMDTLSFSVRVRHNYLKRVIVLPVFQYVDSNKVHVFSDDSLLSDMTTYWGDGDSSKGLRNFHVYGDSGNYKIKMTLISKDSKMMLMEKVVRVEALPETELKAIEAKTIRIYPNPCKDHLMINLPYAASAVITDACGKVIGRFDLMPGASVLDLRDYPSGFLILRLLQADGTSSNYRLSKIN